MNKLTSRYIALSITLLIFGLNYSKANNLTNHWKKINEKENINVYSTEVYGSKILKIKTQTNINASIPQIQSILDNVNHRKNWIPYLQESSIIEKKSDIENIEYSLFSAPWPASDRDFVYKLTQIFNDNSKVIYEMTSITHPAKPEDNKLIRADLIESTYILTQISASHTQVELIFHADPRGWLPNWIINIIQRILPYLILRNLRQQVTDINNTQKPSKIY